MQQRVANFSIGPSTLRGMGPEKTAEAVKSFLEKSSLLVLFAEAGSEKEFVKRLDNQTKLLQKNLPGGVKIRREEPIGEWGARWGVARKCLNIFLYECLNNRWLSKKHSGLLEIEPWLEVPLDSFVGKKLCSEADKSENLPAWKKVTELTQDDSRKYQKFASKLAIKKGIHRVHLDLEFYNNRKKSD